VRGDGSQRIDEVTGMSETYWQVKQGGFIGCPVGTVVSLDRDGDVLRVNKLHVGQMEVIDVREVKQATADNGRDFVLTRRDGGVIVLSPVAPSDVGEREEGPPPAVVVWSYPGRTQAEAAQLFEDHAQATLAHSPRCPHRCAPAAASAQVGRRRARCATAGRWARSPRYREPDV
jgi:hypothetical protein